jgi:hypothetical protein
MGCLNDYDYDILLSHQTYAESEKFILARYWETYYVEPGYSVLSLRILGSDHVPIAVEDNTNNLIIPYTKPCMGTFVVRIKNVPDEVERIRKSFKKDITLKQWRKNVDDTKTVK